MNIHIYPISRINVDSTTGESGTSTNFVDIGQITNLLGPCDSR